MIESMRASLDPVSIMLSAVGCIPASAATSSWVRPDFSRAIRMLRPMQR